MSRGGRRRPTPALAGLGVVGLLAVAAYAGWQIATRESTAPVSPRDAVGRFHALGPAARALPPALRGRVPEPGVYVYATRGFELTHALGARRHAYPARTTITVAVGGCGVRMRWDALATRYDAVELCPRPGAGWRVASMSERHVFLGHRDERTYRCTPGSTSLPGRLATGVRWASRCAIGGTTTADRGVVAGPRTLTVGGQRVRTVLLEVRTRVSGDTRGTGLTLTWARPRDGLVVRRVVANASTTDTVVGDVSYVERFTLALASLRPRT